MSNDPSSAAIARIEQLVRAGQVAAAELACRQFVACAPHELPAWSWLAMLRLIGGDGVESEAAIRQAIAVQPGDARYWNSLSLALRLQYRHAEAETAARQALTLADAAEYWAC